MAYYNSPRWSAEIEDCSMPMTFDTYSNCSFGCLYCFSQFQRGIGNGKDAYLHKQIKYVNVKKIKNLFIESLKGNNVAQFSEYIRQRKVMQWGGLSDQFDGFEKRFGVTLELLKFFKEIDYPLCFSTKSVWWTKDERYLELFKGQKNWNVKFSIITLDENKANSIERGVPSPMERLEALKTVASLDCGGATLRLRPFIIGISDPSYIDLIKQAHKNGASALSTEFFCADTRSNSLKSNYHIFNDCCGYDIQQLYKTYSTTTGYMRLNRKIKEPYIKVMKELCDNLGMRFYVSDAHFKELCSNGSCCGLPESWNYSRGQWCEALMIAKKRGEVRFRDISNDILTLHQYPWDRACGYNNTCTEKRAKFYGMSMADYMRFMWNNPQEGHSPYKMYAGVLVPERKDEDGNIVYKYNRCVTLNDEDYDE